MVDTNVLLTATDGGRPMHHLAVAVLESWPASGAVLYTSGQILREYLAVATRPVADNGLGLAQPDGVGDVGELRQRGATPSKWS